ARTIPSTAAREAVVELASGLEAEASVAVTLESDGGLAASAQPTTPIRAPNASRPISLRGSGEHRSSCMGWTGASRFDTGIYRFPASYSTSDEWTKADRGACSGFRRLYCFEQ